VLWIVGAVSIFALARPLGTLRHNDTNVLGRDVVLVLDVSRSMGAQDAFPSRLAVAKDLARGVLAGFTENPHDRAALVAFAGRATVRTPLTENLGAVLDAVERLAPGDVQPSGTDLGAALAAALSLFDDQNAPEGKSVVLISDGEDHAAAWEPFVAQSRDRHVMVHCLAVGDDLRGSPLNNSSAAPNNPATAAKTTIVTKRQDSALRAIAQATGGAFVAVGNKSVDADALFRSLIEPGARRMRRVLGWTQRVELYGWLVAPALFLLALQGTGTMIGRRRTLSTLLLATTCNLALSAARPPLDQGIVLFRKGDFEGARLYYSEVRKRHPNQPVLAYNEGEALFQLGRFEDAIASYRHARKLADGFLRLKLDYSQGNALVAMRQFEAAIEQYDACLSNPTKGLEAEDLRRDARINRAFAIDRLDAASSRSGTQNSPPEGNGPDAPPPQSENEESQRKGPSPAGSEEKGPSRTASENQASETSQVKSPETDEPQVPSPAPEQRLAAALRNINRAKSARLSAAESPRAATGMPDW
jgi:Ca-activated chloride channel family protein